MCVNWSVSNADLELKFYEKCNSVINYSRHSETIRHSFIFETQIEIFLMKSESLINKLVAHSRSAINGLLVIVTFLLGFFTFLP